MRWFISLCSSFPMVATFHVWPGFWTKGGSAGGTRGKSKLRGRKRRLWESRQRIRDKGRKSKRVALTNWQLLLVACLEVLNMFLSQVVSSNMQLSWNWKTGKCKNFLNPKECAECRAECRAECPQGSHSSCASLLLWAGSARSLVLKVFCVTISQSRRLIVLAPVLRKMRADQVH